MTDRRTGLSGGALAARIGATTVIVLGLVVSTTVPAYAAWVGFYNAVTNPNIWRWSGTYSNTGIYADSFPFVAPIRAMRSGSSAIYGADNVISVSFPRANRAVACAHLQTYEVALYCARGN